MSWTRKECIERISRLDKPFFKMNSAQNRIDFYNIVHQFLLSVNPCISFSQFVKPNGEKTKRYMVLTDSITRRPIVRFDTKIGTMSKYAFAYINYGIGPDFKDVEMIKLSCKMTKTFAIEIEVMNVLTNIVINNEFPNFPMMYAYLMCKDVTFYKYLPIYNKNQKFTSYTIICSELANYDLKTWLESIKPRTKKQYDSIIAQMMLAIYKLHTLGYVHGDLHAGNMLVHKVTPGGYWHYVIGTTHVYVPNDGYLLVLWDFGESQKSKSKILCAHDHMLAAGEIRNSNSYGKMTDFNYSILGPLVSPIYKKFEYFEIFDDRIETFDESGLIIQLLSSKIFDHIVISPQQLTLTLVNNKPFICDT